MHTSTPITLQPAQSGVGEGGAKVAVAVHTGAEEPSILFCRTLTKALAASLRRHSVPIVEELPVYHKHSAVAVFEIPSAHRAVALEAVKGTLAELGLLIYSTFAVDRAGVSWFIVRGIGAGGIKFDDGFLRPEQLHASLSAFQKWNDDNIAFWQGALEEAMRRADGEAENPNAS